LDQALLLSLKVVLHVAEDRVVLLVRKGAARDLVSAGRVRLVKDPVTISSLRKCGLKAR
jgi:hypothetical protein